MDFETWEHILTPIILALLAGGGLASLLAQRTTAKTAYVNGLRSTIESMQQEMDKMGERMTGLQREIAASQLTIMDLRSQIATLQTANFTLASEIISVKRENTDLHAQLRGLQRSG